MRVTRLSAHGLFSFGEDPFVLDLSKGGLSVVVGPNASGKSNLGALIDLVVAVVALNSSVTSLGRTVLGPATDALHTAALQARHLYLPEDKAVEARLGITLTSDEERELVASFMRGTIASSPSANGSRSQTTSHQESWAAGLPTDSFDALFRGELVVSHSGVAGSDWWVRFEPAGQIGDVDVAVLMGRYEATLVRAGETLPTDRRSDLGAVLGFESGAQTTEPTPIPPEPDTVLESLVPDPGKGTVLLVRSVSSSPEQLPEAVRIFLRRASLESSLQPNSTWGPGVVWERILRQGVRHLRAHGAALTAFDDAGLPRAQWTYTPDSLSAPAGPEVTDLPRRLWELHNGGPSSAKRLQAIHEVFTQLAPDWEFAVAGSLESSHDPIQPIPLHLAVEADTYEVSGFAGPYPRVQVVPAWPATDHLHVNTTLQVRLSARRNDGNWEPLAGVGTGVSQALVLAETIGDAAGRFVFLDEPAANLHPSWQRHVRARLEAISDPDATDGPGQFVMVTHSAALAAPVHQSRSALPSRLTNDGKSSALINPPHGALPGDWPRDLQLSPDGWGLLFADAVILVEGETELGALPRWFDKITEAAGTLAWSARNIAMFSTGGDQGFESWGRYLSHYHVPWAVVCDGVILDPYQPLNSNPVSGKATAQYETTPVTWQKRSAWALLQVARARGNEQLCDETKCLFAEPDAPGTRPDGPTFDEVTRLGETRGVFTLANWFARPGKLPQPPEDIFPVESIDDLIKQKESLQKAIESAREELGERRNKVRLGLYVADACPPPKPVHDLFDKLLNWFAGATCPGMPDDQ